MGAIDPAADDQTFNLAVRHCLNTVLKDHPREVLEILHRYPDRDNKAYLLGLLLGGSLDRSCPQYPIIKERLRSLGHVAPPKEPRT